MTLWLHFFRPRPAWYDLEPGRQQELTESWIAVRDRACSDGAEFLGEYAVRGQSIHERVQVWRLSGPAAIEDLWTALEEAGYADWRESENVVGVPPIAVAYRPPPG